MTRRIRLAIRSQQERGAVAVEFAILVLPLLAILLGVLHFGFILAQKASLSSAVRSGARYGSVNLYDSASDPHTCAKAIQRAKEAVSTVGMEGSLVQFEVLRGPSLSTASPICGDLTAAPCEGAGNNDTLFLRATFESNTVGIPGTPIDSTQQLESVGAYRCEYN